MNIPIITSILIHIHILTNTGTMMARSMNTSTPTNIHMNIITYIHILITIPDTIMEARIHIKPKFTCTLTHPMNSTKTTYLTTGINTFTASGETFMVWAQNSHIE